MIKKDMMLLMIFRSILSYLLIASFFLVIAIPLLLLILLPDRIRLHNRYVYRFFDLCYRSILRCTLVPIAYYGLEHVPDDQPVVIVSNHQSILDVPLIGAVCKGHPHRWLASSALLKYPHLRFLLPRFCQTVDTSSSANAMKSLLAMVRHGKNSNSHLIIFPEGQRYNDGAIHDFYGGFVILATATGRPVVPVRIFNANLVYPYGSILVHPYPITVVVGKPLFKEDEESSEQFKKRIEEWFLHQMEE